VDVGQGGKDIVPVALLERRQVGGRGDQPGVMGDPHDRRVIAGHHVKGRVRGDHPVLIAQVRDRVAERLRGFGMQRPDSDALVTQAEPVGAQAASGHGLDAAQRTVKLLVGELRHDDHP
jgi:hypothetical protein